MNYFDFLRLLHLKDTQENFTRFLIDILDYKQEQAQKESKLYYKNEKE